MATRQNVSDGRHAVAAPVIRAGASKLDSGCIALTVHPGGVCRIDREDRRRVGEPSSHRRGPQPVPGVSCRYRADSRKGVATSGT